MSAESDALGYSLFSENGTLSDDIRTLARVSREREKKIPAVF